MVSTKVVSKDVYKLFLQAAMSRRVMSEAIAKALWKACTEAVAKANNTLDVDFVDGTNEWNLFLDKVKHLLDPLDLEFARCKDEDTAKVMYAITNTKGDEVAQLASDYNPTEIAFFKAIIEQIMLAQKRAYCISSLAALREIGFLKGSSMTKQQGEVILASFVARGWLVRSKRGLYSLGTRSILELGTYLKNTYDDTDVLECVLCMDMVTKGYMCPRANCNSPLHKHCYELNRRRNVCPKCQQAWDEPGHADLIPIGEDAVKDGQPERRRVRRRTVGEGEDDMEEEEGGGESQGMSQTQPSQTQTQTQTQPRSQRTQKKKKSSQKVNGTKANGKSKKRAALPEFEEDELEDMYDDDDDDDDDGKDADAIDIDDLAEIRERPPARNGSRR